MSWDVSIQKFSRQYKSVAEMPRDEPGVNLGSRASVHQAVCDVFSGTDWSDPSWGMWESSCGSIEFNLGEDDPANGVMLHVRASSEVIPKIIQLCNSNGWQGIDCSTGEFIEQSENPEKGLEAWQNFRAQIAEASGGVQPEKCTPMILFWIAGVFIAALLIVLVSKIR